MARSSRLKDSAQRLRAGGLCCGTRPASKSRSPSLTGEQGTQEKQLPAPLDTWESPTPTGGQIALPEDYTGSLEKFLLSTAPGHPEQNLMECNPKCVRKRTGTVRRLTV